MDFKLSCLTLAKKKKPQHDLTLVWILLIGLNFMTHFRVGVAIGPLYHLHTMGLL